MRKTMESNVTAHPIASIRKELELDEPVSLPKSSSQNDIVKVSLAHYGRLATKRGSMCTNPLETPEEQHRRTKEPLKVPIFGALIEKEGKGYLWDLGITKDYKYFSGLLKAFLDDVFTPVDLVPTSFAPRLVDEARKGRDIPPIDSIFVSHAHSDHFGDPTAFPSKVHIIYGPGTTAWVQSGAPNVQLPREYFQQHPILEVGTDALGNGNGWQRIGPFESGWDFFGDGSLWLIQAPGHCLGCQVALCRVTTSPDTYVLLAGDAAHSQSHYAPVLAGGTYGLLGKIRLPGEPEDVPASHYAYDDPDAAYETISKLIRMNQLGNVMTVAAHEYEMEAVLGMEPGDLSKPLTDWKATGLKEKKARLHSFPQKRPRVGLL